MMCENPAFRERIVLPVEGSPHTRGGFGASA